MDIKVLGQGCQKCKSTYNNVIVALNELSLEADVKKIEDIEEIMKYDVLSTPALMINGQIKIKGRVAKVSEIKKLLT